ncbi:MAG TPA: four-helix bundle copper-binding protein [Solirubrobacteraceae bacterium]|jgi:hypothetical protein|nr:four-helix bundle copper-binding protein [Solirubrobacteraceae bacterium]
MTVTRDMLDASPSRAPLGVAEVAAAIDECLNCLQACISDADADLAERDIEEVRTCIALCLNCADVCDFTARVLSRPAQWDDFVVDRLLQACVRTCTVCADECAKHADHHRHCAICEKACRACIQACSALLAAEAVEELEKLGGA